MSSFENLAVNSGTELVLFRGSGLSDQVLTIYAEYSLRVTKFFKAEEKEIPEFTVKFTAVLIE